MKLSAVERDIIQQIVSRLTRNPAESIGDLQRELLMARLNAETRKQESVDYREREGTQREQDKRRAKLLEINASRKLWDRRVKATRLRSQGASLHDIGEAMGVVSRSTILSYLRIVCREADRLMTPQDSTRLTPYRSKDLPSPEACQLALSRLKRAQEVEDEVL